MRKRKGKKKKDLHQHYDRHIIVAKEHLDSSWRPYPARETGEKHMYVLIMNRRWYCRRLLSVVKVRPVVAVAHGRVSINVSS